MKLKTGFIAKMRHGLVEGDIVDLRTWPGLWRVESTTPDTFTVRQMTRCMRFCWWFNYGELI